MADRKIIEFQFSGGDDGNQPGRSLVPVTPQNTNLDPNEKRKAEQFGEILGESQAEAYSRFFGEFFEEWIKTFGGQAEAARKAEEDIIEGEFTVESGGGGKGKDPNDPFAFMDEPYGQGDWFKEWMDELGTEYRAHAELLDKVNAQYDEQTAQADALLEENNALIGVVGKTALAFTAFLLAARLFQEAVEDMAEAVGPFSAETNIAQVEGRIQQLEDQIQAAGQIGAETADLTRLQNEISREVRLSFTNFYDLISPILEFIGEAVLVLVSVIRGILEIGVFIKDIFQAGREFIAQYFPQWMVELSSGISLPLKGIHMLLKKIKGNTDKSVNQTTMETMDKLFGPDDFKFDPASIRENVEAGKATPPSSNSPAKFNTGLGSTDYPMY
jgi:hypothetical protein